MHLKQIITVVSCDTLAFHDVDNLVRMQLPLTALALLLGQEDGSQPASVPESVSERILSFVRSFSRRSKEQKTYDVDKVAAVHRGSFVVCVNGPYYLCFWENITHTFQGSFVVNEVALNKA